MFSQAVILFQNDHGSNGMLLPIQLLCEAYSEQWYQMGQKPGNTVKLF